MHEEEIIKQLKDEMKRLKRENELLKDQIAKLVVSLFWVDAIIGTTTVLISSSIVQI